MRPDIYYIGKPITDKYFFSLTKKPEFDDKISELKKFIDRDIALLDSILMYKKETKKPQSNFESIINNIKKNLDLYYKDIWSYEDFVRQMDRSENSELNIMNDKNFLYKIKNGDALKVLDYFIVQIFDEKGINKEVYNKHNKIIIDDIGFTTFLKLQDSRENDSITNFDNFLENCKKNNSSYLGDTLITKTNINFIIFHRHKIRLQLYKIYKLIKFDVFEEPGYIKNTIIRYFPSNLKYKDMNCYKTDETGDIKIIDCREHIDYNSNTTIKKKYTNTYKEKGVSMIQSTPIIPQKKGYFGFLKK